MVSDVHRREYFYPRPPRGGRRRDPEALVALREISIHALREEGDNPGDQRVTNWF